MLWKMDTDYLIYVGISLRCNNTLHHEFMFMLVIRININWLWGNWKIKIRWVKTITIKINIIKYKKVTHSQFLLWNLASVHQSWDVHSTSLVQLSLFWTVLYQCLGLSVACRLYTLARRVLKSQLNIPIIMTIPKIIILNSNILNYTYTCNLNSTQLIQFLRFTQLL